MEILAEITTPFTPPTHLQPLAQMSQVRIYSMAQAVEV
jgi:hypothetical protein